MTQQPIDNISPANIGQRIRVLGPDLEVTGDMLALQAIHPELTIAGDVTHYDLYVQVDNQVLLLSGRETFEVVGSSPIVTTRVKG